MPSVALVRRYRPFVDVGAASDAADELGIEHAVSSTYAGTEGRHGGLRVVTIRTEGDNPHIECCGGRATRLLDAVARRTAALMGAGRVTRVWVGQLDAGGSIARHVDTMPPAPRRRFHLVLRSNLGATFTTGRDTFHMREGWVYEVDPLAEHAAANVGVTPRVHLIVDAEHRPWPEGGGDG